MSWFGGEPAAAPKAAPNGPSWLLQTADLFAAVERTADGGILCESFLAACDNIAQVRNGTVL